MDHSPQEINEIFKKLPQALRDAISSVETAEIINEIGKRYGLHIDQIGILGSETGRVLIGLAHPTEFVSNITKKLDIERVVASQIASDINDKVFLKVRELLKGISGSPTSDVKENTDPRPLRDALLKAIENPEVLQQGDRISNEGRSDLQQPKSAAIPLVEIKNPYEPAKPEPPVVAPIPSTPTPSILEQKMSGQVSLPKTEKKVDMYREQV